MIEILIHNINFCTSKRTFWIILWYLILYWIKGNSFRFSVWSDLNDFSVRKSEVINFIKEFFGRYKAKVQRKKSDWGYCPRKGLFSLTWDLTWTNREAFARLRMYTFWRRSQKPSASWIYIQNASWIYNDFLSVCLNVFELNILRFLRSIFHVNVMKFAFEQYCISAIYIF